LHVLKLWGFRSVVSRDMQETHHVEAAYGGVHRREKRVTESE